MIIVCQAHVGVDIIYVTKHTIFLCDKNGHDKSKVVPEENPPTYSSMTQNVYTLPHCVTKVLTKYAYWFMSTVVFSLTSILGRI